MSPNPMPALPPVPEPELCSQCPHEVPRPRKKKRRVAASAGTPVPNTPRGSIPVLDSDESQQGAAEEGAQPAEGAAAEAAEAALPQHVPKKKKRPKKNKFPVLKEDAIFADTIGQADPELDVSKGGAEATPHDGKPRGLTTRKEEAARTTQRASATTFPASASGDQLEELVKQTLSAMPPRTRRPNSTRRPPNHESHCPHEDR